MLLHTRVPFIKSESPFLSISRTPTHANTVELSLLWCSAGFQQVFLRPTKTNLAARGCVVVTGREMVEGQAGLVAAFLGLGQRSSG
jgi:hypothetical protein